ncbi:hypothetical protein DIC82_18075 [Clostridium beijerinckii]|nr:hypothetical protein DIC82_18075 [Clostridium beijerinckii]
MRNKLDHGKELEIKIEIARELLHNKIEENLDPKEIQKVSEELDKLIVDYLVK